jgi:hypothetical protein
MRPSWLILGLVLVSPPLAAQSATTGILPGTLPVSTPLGSGFEARVQREAKELFNSPISFEEGAPPFVMELPTVKVRCVTTDNTTVGMPPREPKPPDDPGQATVVSSTLLPDGSIGVIVYPTSWEIVGSRLLPSPGGPWSYRATLDPAVAQAPGSLTLWPEAGDPSRGVFTGILPITARLYLENAGLGLTYDLPLELDIPLRGSWTAPPLASGMPAPAPSASNLSLYVWPLELWRIHRPDCWDDEALWQDGEVVETLSCDRCVARIAPALPGSPPSCS